MARWMVRRYRRTRSARRRRRWKTHRLAQICSDCRFSSTINDVRLRHHWLVRLTLTPSRITARSFVQPLASFAFASSPYQPDSTHFIGISRDYATLGSTEHRIEIIQHKSTKFSAFTESGITLSSSASAPSSSIASTSALRIGTTQFSIPDEADDVVSGDEAEGTFISRPLDRGRSLSVTTAYQRDSTIGSTTRGSTVGANLRRTISRNTEPDLTGAGDESVEGEEGLRGLMNDPSVLVRRRIEKGYASKALLNSKIVERDGSLKEFWLWIHRASASPLLLLCRALTDCCDNRSRVVVKRFLPVGL